MLLEGSVYITSRVTTVKVARPFRTADLYAANLISLYDMQQRAKHLYSSSLALQLNT